MYKLRILPSAKRDIKETADWYNSRQEGLGLRFTKETRSKLNLVKLNPYISAIRYDNIRTSVFDIFLYMAHYAIDEQNKVITIFAILYTSRNPEIWGAKRDDAENSV